MRNGVVRYVDGNVLYFVLLLRGLASPPCAGSVDGEGGRGGYAFGVYSSIDIG